MISRRPSSRTLMASESAPTTPMTAASAGDERTERLIATRTARPTRMTPRNIRPPCNGRRFENAPNLLTRQSAKKASGEWRSVAEEKSLRTGGRAGQSPNSRANSRTHPPAGRSPVRSIMRAMKARRAGGRKSDDRANRRVNSRNRARRAGPPATFPSESSQSQIISRPAGRGEWSADGQTGGAPVRFEWIKPAYSRPTRPPTARRRPAARREGRADFGDLRSKRRYFGGERPQVSTGRRRATVKERVYAQKR